MNGQLDLFHDYAATREPGPSDAVELWREERKRQVQQLGLKFGIPLHEEVEVWLTQGIRLRGLIRLDDEDLWVEGDRDGTVLRIGRATFRLGEVESLVRV